MQIHGVQNRVLAVFGGLNAHTSSVGAISCPSGELAELIAEGGSAIHIPN
jgi:hypothetical protein